MNMRNLAAILSAVTLLGLIATPTNTKFATAVEEGFLTSAEPYISMANSRNSIKAIITQGDTIGDYTFAKIPDGIGAFEGEDDGDSEVLNVFVNHELDGSAAQGGFARVSKLALNEDAKVISASYPIDGSEGYERLCSSSLAEGFGFEDPIYFTNEEVNDGIVVAVNGNSDELTEMPWLGELSHENTIHVPYFEKTLGKTVVITTEDGDATDSEVYMFVADSPEDLLAGNGQLYVWGAKDKATFNTWDDIYFSTGTVKGNFFPLDWDHATQDEADLHNEAVAEGAFLFVRPEDAAMDKRDSRGNIMYMADTGNDRDENGALIPPGSNGQSFTKGRMYKFEFTDPQDPTKANFRVIMDGNDPKAPGFGVMVNPDNIDTSQRSLMINEDWIGVNRSPATETPYDITKNSKILRVDLSSGKIEKVAFVNQLKNSAFQHGNWESSGILDASEFFGKGTWLVDVQAHGLAEGGQLLLMKVMGS